MTFVFRWTRGEALRARFAAEDEYRGREADVEIGVLEARSRDALLQTHSRYWLSLDKLAEAIRAAEAE